LSIAAIIGIAIGGFGGVILIFGLIIFGIWYRNRLRNSRIIAVGPRGVFGASSSNQLNRRSQLNNESSAVNLPVADPMKEEIV
jgi:hypothetical protein